MGYLHVKSQEYQYNLDENTSSYLEKEHYNKIEPPEDK